MRVTSHTSHIMADKSLTGKDLKGAYIYYKTGTEEPEEVADTSEETESSLSSQAARQVQECTTGSGRSELSPFCPFLYVTILSNKKITVIYISRKCLKLLFVIYKERKVRDYEYEM